MDNTEIRINNELEYKISTHARQRYAERIMGKDDKGDINRFINTNEEKIKTDIHKLIYYGQLIYSGRQSQKDGKGKVLDVYLKDCWVILVDNSNNTVVTLYKIDLGLDEDFNKAYISKMMERLNKDKEGLEIIQQQVEAESNMYKELIEDAETQINEYRTMIKNLEELCSGYQTIIGNNHVKITEANRKVADTLNTLLNKKEF